MHVDDGSAALGAAVMRVVSAAAKELPGGPGRDAEMAHLVREAASLVPHTAAFLCVLDGRGHVDVRAASGGLEPLLRGVHGRLDDTQLAEPVRDRRVATLIPDPDVDSVIAPHLRSAGVRGMRVQPLPAGGTQQPIAVLVTVKLDDAGFTEAQARVLDAWGGVVSMRLARGAPPEDGSRLARRLELVDLAVDLAGAGSQQELNDGLLSRVLRIARVDRAVMLRLDGDDAVAEAVQDSEGRAPERARRYSIGDHPLLRRAFLEREPLFDDTPSLGAIPEDMRDITRDGRHFGVIPLLRGDDVIGFLSVVRRHERSFDDDDIEVLRMVGRLVAVALVNARLLDDATAARRIMSEFLRVIMHELRGPLTIIGGYLSMIQEGVFGDVPDAWTRPLDTMDAKVREAQHLVDELLLASRLEDGHFPVHVEEVDAGDAMRRAIARAQPRAQLLQATLEAHAGEGIVACADRTHVDRILDNLINNGLTYGGQPPLVRVEVVGDHDVEVRVTDNGRGVDEDDRARVFERFYRGHGSGAGSGLGLYISRLLAELCGGSLELATSAPGHGASFILHLPAAAPAAVG